MFKLLKILNFKNYFKNIETLSKTLKFRYGEKPNLDSSDKELYFKVKS